MKKSELSEWEKMNLKRQALSKTDPVIKYNEYLTYPYEKKLGIIRAWEKYYEDVKKSPAYTNFIEQRDAMRQYEQAYSPEEKDRLLKEIKERGKWARELREQGETVQRPFFPYDPTIFFSIAEIAEYLKVMRKMTEATSSAGVNF